MSNWHIFDNIGTPSQGRKEKRKVPVPLDPDPPQPEPLKRRRTVADDASALTAARQNFMKSKLNALELQQQAECLQPIDFPFIQGLLQAAPVDAQGPLDIPGRDAHRKVIEVVSRKYQDSFLREPINDERPCALGGACEGMHVTEAVLSQSGFIIREFLLPSQLAEYEETGEWPREPSLCLLCKRSEIAKAFFNIRSDGAACKSGISLQNHRVIVDCSGEYRLQNCIVSCPERYEGLLDPVVLYNRNDYSPRRIGGVKTFLQKFAKFG
jgi:hypothetical protein|tara:strand:+ start:152 stop:955 length:804 start_codon:yes stop_codon:yes gene_type:complete